MGAPFAWAPHVILLLQNQAIAQNALTNLLFQLPIMCLKDINKIVILVNKMIERGRGECQGTHYNRVDFYDY